MTDRERLIELLNDFAYDIILCDTCEILDRDCAACENERLAEYLLENGVIVPPCKVGDMVYYPWVYDDNKGIAFTEVENIKIYVNGIPLVFVKNLGSDMPIPTAFYPENFGKTVFLTREEAERKLRELEEND